MKLAWLVKSSSEDTSYEIIFEQPDSWYSVVVPIVYAKIEESDEL